MSNPVSNADRKEFMPAHDDPDLARVRDVLGYYGSAAGYSRACLQDLVILIKKARQVEADPYQEAGGHRR